MGQMQDFSLQGKIYLGENVNGKPRNLKWVGDQSSLNISIETQFEERKENFSGQRYTSVRLKQGSAINPEREPASGTFRCQGHILSAAASRRSCRIAIRHIPPLHHRVRQIQGHTA